MRLGSYAFVWLVCCTHLPVDYDATPERDAQMKLTLAAPACAVADVTQPYSVSYSTDTAGEMHVEVYRADGTSVTVADQSLNAGVSGTLNLPAGTFVSGTNAVVMWVYAFKKISSTAKLVLDVRTPIAGASTVDADGDCYSPQLGDCDDTNPAIHPSAIEVCNDHIDNDCNGLVDAADPQCSAACSDGDHDGYISTSCGGNDCNDADPAINPAAAEVCDGVDNNCDGKIDEAFDTDGDGFASCPGETVKVDGTACPAGFATCSDCNDSDKTTFPGGSPYCDAQGKLHSCVPNADCIPTVTCATGVDDPSAPVIFFSDLTSGPTTGGENNEGVFVTIYGLRFGATRGSSTIKIGGIEVAKYIRWNLDATTGDDSVRNAREMQTITFQPGGAITTSGNIVVTVNGKSSNGIPFAVRSGGIYFVDPAASYQGNGDATDPWQNLGDARDHPPGAGGPAAPPLTAGDTVYIKAKTSPAVYNGQDTTAPVFYTCMGAPCTSGSGTTPGYVNLFFPMDAAKGTANAPIAFVGYPGSPPVIGGTDATGSGTSDYGIWLYDNLYSTTDSYTESPLDYYVFANMIFQNTRRPISTSGTGKRIVGNKFIKISSSEFATMWTSPGGSDMHFLGNLFSGTHGDSITGFTVDGLEIGWNEFANEAGRMVDTDGYGMLSSNVQVHDNIGYGMGAGISVGEFGATTSNSDVYNNIIIDPIHYAMTLKDSVGVTFDNNTIYCAGTGNTVPLINMDMSTPGNPGRFVMNNNIMYADDSASEYYVFVTASDKAAFTGSHNLYFNIPLSSNNSSPWLPDPTTALYGDPQWLDPTFSVDQTNGNFQVAPSSPARNHATSTTHCSDYYGVVRPQGKAFDMGAVEFH